MRTTIKLRIYSPRWGHDDTYTVDMASDYVEITLGSGPRKTRADWSENTDPVWKGEPILQIFRNDSIYAPEVTQRLFEHVWVEWRNNNISSEEADNELQLIAEWLNTITKAKPRSDFWRKYF